MAALFFNPYMHVTCIRKMGPAVRCDKPAPDAMWRTLLDSNQRGMSPCPVAFEATGIVHSPKRPFVIRVYCAER
jgi:hypothetical protein